MKSVCVPCVFRAVFRAEEPLKVRKPVRVSSHKSRFRPVFIALEGRNCRLSDEKSKVLPLA